LYSRQVDEEYGGHIGILEEQWFIKVRFDGLSPRDINQRRLYPNLKES
jgi:hypothetical protein